MSIEHISAVTHPRTVWTYSERAVDATIITAVMDVARFMMCDRLSRISGSGVSVSCTFIIITCYVLMADALLKKVRASLNQVEVQRVTRSSQPGTLHTLYAE